MNGLALFAGVGGLDLGINIALPESRAVCYVEGEAYAASVLAKQMEQGRLHPAPIWSNVVTFDGRPWRGKVDFISAGFPCQPWSTAGKKEGVKDKRWLWNDIERIIREVQPRFVFLENVTGIINGGLSPILKSLSQIGFNAEWGTLRASKVGANHQRNRFFLFAYVPNSKCVGWNENKLNTSKRESDFIGCCSNVSYPNDSRFRKQLWAFSIEKKYSAAKCGCWWQIEPGVGRVVDGMAHRVDRLRACGNGVVPLQAGVAYSILINRAIERGCLNGA